MICPFNDTKIYVFFHLKCRKSCQFAYFGAITYQGALLPTLVDSVWVHYGDDELDVNQDNQYIEDSEVHIIDVCHSSEIKCGPQQPGNCFY